MSPPGSVPAPGPPHPGRHIARDHVPVVVDVEIDELDLGELKLRVA